MSFVFLLSTFFLHWQVQPAATLPQAQPSQGGQWVGVSVWGRKRYQWFYLGHVHQLDCGQSLCCHAVKSTVRSCLNPNSFLVCLCHQDQGFLRFSVQKNHWGVLLKYRLWFGRSRVCLKNLVSKRPQAMVHAVSPRNTLRGAKFWGMILTNVLFSHL